MSTGNSQWLCVKSFIKFSFTEGEVYNATEKGLLIDNEGFLRPDPNSYGWSTALVAFKPVPFSLENK